MSETNPLDAVDGLDGQTRTLITHTIGEWEVMIGGGPELFILTANVGGGLRTANALTSSPVDRQEIVELVLGGQTIKGPRGYALTREEIGVALEDLAAGTFPEHRWAIIG